MNEYNTEYLSIDYCSQYGKEHLVEKLLAFIK